MKAVLNCLIFFVVLFTAGTVPAVSPQPSEIEHGVSRKHFTTMQHDTDTTCKVRIVYMRGSSNDNKPKEDLSLPLYFDHHMPKKDVLEKVLELSKDNLNEINISSVSIECSFHDQKEGGI